MKIVVVIPTRNEEKTIAKTIKSVPDSLYPVIVADGASSDQTVKIALELGATVVDSEGKNYGDAVLTGIKAALEQKPTIIIVMDSESHVYQEIVDSLPGDWDVLAGCRHHEHKSLVRRYISKIGRGVNRFLIGSPLKDPSNGFRAYRGCIANELIEEYQGKTIPSYAFNCAVAAHPRLIERRWKLKEFPMSYKGGKSGLTKRELIKAAIWIWRYLI